MEFQYSPFAVPLFLSGALAAAIAVVAWRRRSRTAAREMAIDMAGHTVWMVGQGLSVSAVALRWTEFWFTVSLYGVGVAAAGWMLFAMAYTGSRVTWRRIGLALAPVFVGLSLSLPNVGELTYAGGALAESTLVPGAFAPEWGPLALLVVAYFATAAMAANVLMARKILHSRNYYRRSSFFYLFTSVVSLCCFLVSIAGISPLPGLMLWPYAFLAFGVVAAGAMVTPQVFNRIPVGRLFALVGSRYEGVVPMARDLVVEELGSGVVVLDSENRIVDINPVGRRMLAPGGQRIVGKRIESVLDEEAFLTDDLAFLDPEIREETFEGVWVEGVDGPRCYDILVTDLSRKRDDVTGRVGLIHDVTEKQRRKQALEERTGELERQNERLEEFASIVTHDLRNPLTTAQGYVDVAEESGDPEDFDEIRVSLSRMENIVDDVLAIAREGRTVTDAELVDLGELARDAWRTVDTGGAELLVETDDRIEADPDRIRRALENLFRNAVEHGGPGVTVRVGWSDDGFYVEDDGPGIDPEIRDDVLERGFTTSERGTGFGLAIVDTIVDAHGWGLAVTEGRDGGARIAVTGCETASVEPIDV